MNNEEVETEIIFNLSETHIHVEETESSLNPEQVLPSPSQIRQSRHKLALFTEQGVALELLQSQGGVMGTDGTPLAQIGKTLTTPVTINGKLRAINNIALANETTENLVTALIYQCDRLGTLAGTDAKDIWSKIIAIVSDLASENKGLSQAVSDALGLSYVPGQGFCAVHSVLGFDEALKQVCLKVQAGIGTQKLLVNSSSASTGSDLEDFDIASYAVNALMKLISPTFSNKPWSRYSQFTDFMESKGEANLAFALKDRRFGKLCATSAVTIHHWDDLKLFLEKEQSSARNVLACMARSILESEVTRLLVLSNAMVGVHLEEPYLHMLITLNANQSDLLSTLPQLYTELKAPVGDPPRFGSPCLPALSSAFLSSPYDKAVMQSLASTIETKDQALLRKYLLLSLSKC